jgi:hypothetical protein
MLYSIIEQVATDAVVDRLENDTELDPGGHINFSFAGDPVLQLGRESGFWHCKLIVLFLLHCGSVAEYIVSEVTGCD